MKKYKIRKGSFLWYLKGWWLVFLCAAVLVVIAFPEPKAEAKTLPEIEVTPTVSEMEKVKAYDVPLEKDLQEHIQALCEIYEVDMPLVLAIIGQESNYNPAMVGDNGNSIGLMQIQPKYHEARMERLSAVNLKDPYQNATVGIDYLSELLKKEKGEEWAVTAYNAGPTAADYYMTIGERTEYTESVLELREEIKALKVKVL